MMTPGSRWFSGNPVAIRLRVTKDPEQGINDGAGHLLASLVEVTNDPPPPSCSG